jgi:hypothetical protein
MPAKLMPGRMSVTVAAIGKADSTVSLQAVQNAVARALRSEGVAVTSNGVRVEGKLG